MPSREHEALADLVRERPSLVVPLLEGAGVVVRGAEAARLVDPTFAGYASDYAADAAVALIGPDDDVRLVVIVEVQLGRDAGKRFSWPAYETLAHARHRVSACVLVIAPDAAIARWASQPVVIGPSESRFVPLVIGPMGIPLVIDVALARRLPELAVLSAVAHGEATNGLVIIETAIRAMDGLDEGRAKSYIDLIYEALSESTRSALEARMNDTNHESFYDRIVQHYRKRYRAEGGADELAAAVLQLLSARGLVVTDSERATVVGCVDLPTLRSWHARAVTATTVAEVLAAVPAAAVPSST